jgi:NTE family protein
MIRSIKRLNIIMSGGGMKGIAYVGAFDSIRKKGFLPVNLAGTSSGAIAAALAGAGYPSEGMWDAMESLEFDKFNGTTIHRKVPAVQYLESFAKKSKLRPDDAVDAFLNQLSVRRRFYGADGKPDAMRGILQSVVSLCKEGCLFDGDLLEEWVAGALRKKGIRTFADLRGGRADESNPSGYKVRMTGVDCTRLKLVTLPDDVRFYGIDPDDLEVAKAVRISTAVPFAFKPVVLTKRDSGSSEEYSLIDGGVLDSFPSWLMGNSGIPTAGLRLRSSAKKIVSFATPLSLFKSLVASVHDIGLPEGNPAALAYMGVIDTGDVGFLDFALSGEQKRQLVEAGKKAGMEMFL